MPCSKQAFERDSLHEEAGNDEGRRNQMTRATPQKYLFSYPKQVLTVNEYGQRQAAIAGRRGPRWPLVTLPELGPLLMRAHE